MTISVILFLCPLLNVDASVFHYHASGMLPGASHSTHLELIDSSEGLLFYQTLPVVNPVKAALLGKAGTVTLSTSITSQIINKKSYSL